MQVSRIPWTRGLEGLVILGTECHRETRIQPVLKKRSQWEHDGKFCSSGARSFKITLARAKRKGGAAFRDEPRRPLACFTRTQCDCPSILMVAAQKAKRAAAAALSFAFGSVISLLLTVAGSRLNASTQKCKNVPQKTPLCVNGVGLIARSLLGAVTERSKSPEAPRLMVCGKVQ